MSLTQLLLRQIQQDPSTQSGVMSAIGSSLLRSPVQVQNPWAQLGTNLASSLVGSTLIGYDQAQQQAARKGLAQTVFNSLQQEDPQAALVAAGQPELAQIVAFDELERQAELEQKKNDPEFLYRQKQDVIANQLAKDRFNLDKRQTEAQLGNIGLRNRLVNMQIQAAQEQAQLAPQLAERERLVNAIAMDDKYDKTARELEPVKRFNKARSNFEIVKQTLQEASQTGIGVGLALKPLTRMYSDEAFMADDAVQIARNYGFQGSVDELNNWLLSEGKKSPTLVKELAASANRAMKGMEVAAVDELTNYRGSLASRSRINPKFDPSSVGIDPVYQPIDMGKVNEAISLSNQLANGSTITVRDKNTGEVKQVKRSWSSLLGF